MKIIMTTTTTKKKQVSLIIISGSNFLSHVNVSNHAE